MSDENQDPQKNIPANTGFGLNEPTGQFADLDEQMRQKIQQDAPEVRAVPADDADVKYKKGGWKGLDDVDEDEIDDEPDISFGKKEPIPEDELDMTPMVDVTFLLLIFFMVTASFTIQKSLEQPHAKTDSPSTQVQEQEEDAKDYVQVLIDQTNTFYVTTRDEDEVECPSESEMRARVKDGFAVASAERLIIVAHLDCLHSKVVTAWDAGAINGANQIEIQTTEEDY